MSKAKRKKFADPATTTSLATTANAANLAKIKESDLYMYGAGTTTVTSLLGTGKRVARARQQIYDKWSLMESDAIVSGALKLLVTSALGGHETSGALVFIEPTPDAAKDARKKSMVEEISADLQPLFDGLAFQTAYTGAVFGDSYGRLYAKKGVGVTHVYTDEMIRPPLVQPFEAGGNNTIGYAVMVGERNFERLDTSQMVRLRMPRTQWVPQYGVIEKSMKIAIREDDMDKLPIMPAMAGGSLLYNAEESYDNFTASLLGLVGQRWKDSIDEEMIGVNLESMTKEQQDRYLASVVAMLEKSKSLAEAAVKTGRPVMERIRHLIPVFNEKQLVTPGGVNSSQPGRGGTITIDDVIMHARLLAGTIGVDLSMLGFADQLTGGWGDGGAFRVSAQAAEGARVIRVALSDYFNQIIDIHTLHRYGMVFARRDRPWVINYFGSISALESEKQRTRADAMNAGMLLVQAMAQMKDLGASKEVMTAFLTQTMMLDADQAALYATVVDAKPPDDGDGPSGGGPGGFEK